jgi:hypothetical protein
LKLNNKKSSEIALHHDDIKNKIYTIRGVQVMLDRDISALYEVDTRILNQAVKRNIDRFPFPFMFQLTKSEKINLQSQFVIANLSSKSRTLPFVFSEQGVSMISAILTSKKAVSMSIQIINAFVEMRKFLISNAQIFQRLNMIEHKLLENDDKFDQVFEALELNEIKPKQGIFFDGQIFDAYQFVSDLIRKAKKSIVLIDNFVDERTFLLLSKRQKSVKATIFTKNISKDLKLDLTKYNAQYPKIDLKEFEKAHDRFIILDDIEVYHIGASLKDLGSKWFAFSKMEADSLKLIEKINEL